MHFTCTGEHLMKNWITAERCNIFFITFGLHRKKCRILVEEYGKFVRAAFDAYGRSFWRKPTSRKNLVFHECWDVDGKIFWAGTSLFVHCWSDCVFQFWSSLSTFFPTVLIFFHQFWDFSTNVSVFSSKLSAQLSKKHFTCTDEHLMKKRVPAGICNSFSKTFGLYTKNCRFLVKKFSTFVRAAFYLPGGSFWRKTTYRNNLVFRILLKLRGENNLTRINLVCSLLTRLRFSILELNFEVFSNNLEISHQIRDFSMNFFHI